MSVEPGSPTNGEEVRRNELVAPAQDVQPVSVELPGEGLPPSYLAEYSSQVAPPRFPNIVDVGIGLALAFLGLLISGGLFFAAVRLHYRGISNAQEAAKDIHYTLAVQGAWYLITLMTAALLFRAIWHTSFLRGVDWRLGIALRSRWRILGVACGCFVLAMIDEFALPGPTDAPIEEIFRQPGAAWLMFAFGITLAPLFEEMAFRGFLLPALCTAFDWTMEQIQRRPAPLPDSEGETRWSLPAMVTGSLLTSIPFALIHGAQTAYSLGPFVLLVLVSLALCWVRLSLRSLAASTLTHACYNLMLFSLMLAGTEGFKHLDKL